MSQLSPNKPKLLSKPKTLGSLMKSSSRSDSCSTGCTSLVSGLSIPISPHEKKYDTIDEIAPPRPRRLWKVNDTALRSIPFLYPPLNPRCTVFINDAPPSVVAVRIAECLRKRSISVEYDEEAVTASAMTVNRCHFVIHMFQGSCGALSDHGNSKPDFSHGVIVECVRVRGDVMSFHHACRAILQAAQSHSTGEDMRRPFQSACNDFPRLVGVGGKRKVSINLLPPVAKKGRANPSLSSYKAAERLEHAYNWLKKDRIEPQKLGMEALVSLTDPEACGLESALHCGLAVLGAPNSSTGTEQPPFLKMLHHGWMVQLLQDRTWPGELKHTESSSVSQPAESTSVLAGCLLGEDCNGGRLAGGGAEEELFQQQKQSQPQSQPTTMASWSGGAFSFEENHCGVLRSLALRVFVNALEVVSKKQSDMLRSVLQGECSHLVSKTFLSALVDDLAGAIRPPAVVEGTRLSSVHEAALSIRCLGILGEHSDVAHKFLLSDMALESLEKARAAGRSTHDVLAAEAEHTYSRLTEDARSC